MKHVTYVHHTRVDTLRTPGWAHPPRVRILRHETPNLTLCEHHARQKDAMSD